MARDLHTYTMLPRRFMRITAAIIIVLMAAAVILGYDFHHGVNITETFFEPHQTCELSY